MSKEEEKPYLMLTIGGLMDCRPSSREPVASISARLRDFRKERNGAHTVNRKHIGQGLFEYQLEVRR